MSDAGQNLRLNPNTGNAPTVDTSLAFAGGSVDPNAGDTPMVGAVAYTNPVPGNPTPTSGPRDTLLYDLEAGNDDTGRWKPRKVKTKVVIIVRDLTWKTLRNRGAKVVVTCNQRCTVSATLKLGSRPIAQVKTRLSKAGYTTAYVKLSKSGTRVVKPSKATRHLTVTATGSRLPSSRAGGPLR